MYQPQKRYKAYFTLYGRDMSVDLYCYPQKSHWTKERTKVFIAKQLNLSVRDMDKLQVIKCEQI